MVVTEIGRLIDEYLGAQKHPVSAAWVARQVGVSRSTVSHWYRTSTPTPEHLRRLAQVLEMPYTRLTDAVLVDQGYYATERSGEGRGEQPAASTTPGLTRAQWDERARALQTGPRPLSDAEVVQTLGARPGEVRSGVTGDTAGQGQVAGRRRRAV